MAVGATGFRNSSGTDLNGIFWGWSGDGGNRNITDSNGNCGWNCACNACNGNCNCNCGNCDAADRKSTRLNSSHIPLSRMPSSA